MSASESTIDLSDLTIVLNDLRITNCLTLAATFIVFYDLLLTFDSEVGFTIKYIWTARWSIGKILFIITRYLTLSISVTIAINTMDYESSLIFCKISNWIDGWSNLAVFLPVQLILCLRTSAIWEHSRKISFLLTTLVLSTDGVAGYFIWLTERPTLAESGFQPGFEYLIGCAAAVPGGNFPKLVLPAVGAFMLFDTVIILLTLLGMKDGLWKPGVSGKTKRGRGMVLKVIIHDGLLYYMALSASNLANLLLYALLPPQHTALLVCLVPILRTVLSVCTCRLVLNLRGVVDHIRFQAALTDDLSNPSSESQSSTSYLRSVVRHTHAQVYEAKSAAIRTERCEEPDAWEGRCSYPLGSGGEHGHRWNASGVTREDIFGNRGNSSITLLTASGDRHWFPEPPLAEHGDEITELEVIQGYAT